MSITTKPRSTRERLCARPLMWTALALVLVSGSAQADPESVCTQPELDSLNGYFLRGYQLGMSGQTLEVDTVMAFAAEGEDVMRRLSPGCRAALERVAAAAQERAQASGRPLRLPGVLFDAASDTYTIPNQVSCGPSGCVPLQ